MGPVATRKARGWAGPVLLLGLAVTAPALAGSESRAEAWYAGSGCGGAEAGAKVLASRAEYRTFRKRRSLQGAPGFPRDGRWLLALSMGRQPTTGYRLALAGGGIGFVADGEARLRIRWHEPDPDAVQAQVVTRPCLLLALPPLDVKRLRMQNDSQEAPPAWTVHPPRAPKGELGY